MTDLRFELDFGSGFAEVPPPRNWKEMKIQLIFDKEELQSQLQSIVFEFVNDNAKNIIDYKNNGLTGGTGIFEGIGLRIYGGSMSLLFFDGCIDTTSEAFQIEDDIVKAPIKESGKVDWLNDVAQSIFFQYLTDPVHLGKPWHIGRSDYLQVPYCISTIPNYTQAAMLSVTLFLMVKESIDVVIKIESYIASLIGDSLSWIIMISTIVELIMYLIYLIAIIKAASIIMQELFDDLIQPKKTKLAMRERDSWIKGCAYFGLIFSSTIYGINASDAYNGRYYNATIMPVKIVIPDGDPTLEIYKRSPDETSDPNAYGYYEGTFKQYITDMCLIYNAKIVIQNDILYFEEIHHWNLSNPFMLPNEGDVGFTFNYPKPFTTNASEITGNYLIQFQKDDQDLNTYNDYSGTWSLAQTIPLVVRNKKNQLLSGSTNIQLPFALARRKISLSKLEKKLIEVFNMFSNFLTNLQNSVDRTNSQLASIGFGSYLSETGVSNTDIGFIVSLFDGNLVYGVGSLIFGSDGLPILPAPVSYGVPSDRIGWMLLSSDFTSVQKRFIGIENGIDWYLDPYNEDASVTTSSIATTTISGHFVGNILGIPGISIFTGTVTGGHLLGSCFGTSVVGAFIGVVVGTIVGFPGTFTVNIHGGVAPGAHVLTASGLVNVTTTYTVYGQGLSGAVALMQDFHSQNLINNNQWLIFQDKKFKMELNDYLQINQNNIFVTPDGRKGKFSKLTWDLHNDEAIDVEYRIQEKYTNNYQITYSTDAG